MHEAFDSIRLWPYDSAPVIGEIFSHYRILESWGGGMSVVYKA
jgi:hypothetical protein